MRVSKIKTAWRRKVPPRVALTIYKNLLTVPPDLSYSIDYIISVKASYKCIRKGAISGYYCYYLNYEDNAVKKPFSPSKLDAIKSGKDKFIWLSLIKCA